MNGASVASLKITAAVDRVQELYPRIFFACHTRHVRDPRSRRLLSAHQASILDHLDAVEPVSLRDLARHMGVTPPTMSIAIDRLARRGYVARARDPGDGRRLRLRLTEAGLRLRESQAVLDPRRLRAALALLAPEERVQAVRGLEALGKAAQELMHHAARGGKK